jgi:DNA-binding NarL/FixJ family response regulator
MKNLRILVADDHALVRRGAREVLHSHRGWRVVGEASDGREAVEKAVALQPDVAVIDIGMPECDGIEAARQIRSVAPSTKILVLTMYESDYMVQSAFDAGANGYLLKSDLTDNLVAAVKHLSEGQRFVTPKVFEITQTGSFRGEHRHHQPGRTTPRERQIIRLLAEGKTNKEIGVALGISKRTAEAHRANIMLKLHFHSLAQLVHYALNHGLANVPQGGA